MAIADSHASGGPRFVGWRVAAALRHGKVCIVTFGCNRPRRLICDGGCEQLRGAFSQQ